MLIVYAADFVSIGNKTCYIPRVNKCYVQEEYFC